MFDTSKNGISYTHYTLTSDVYLAYRQLISQHLLRRIVEEHQEPPSLQKHQQKK
jgi:hypothetical protein